ncbi:hypothetical protein BVH74_03870 [Halopseudomonas phragmitis]|uniref:Response regulatory domain-containing protein n=2 Tax=Pseudomonadaceae TaxID=135621 RepID=A0A1V0B230_9GAMM|nr:hypothetical protein BVH74_03870 [Halopseudomonas phragmitis]RHW20524.1 response regulator [Pseudomonas jilinensis]
MLNVIIVEDDEWIAELLAQVIGHVASDARVLRFGNVRDCLNQLKARPVDLLLADLHLPDASGLEAIRVARQRSPASSRVLLTASIDRATVLAARDAGITDFIAKPFSVEVLIERLGKVMQGHGQPTAAPIQLDSLEHFLTQRPEQALFIPWCEPAHRQSVLHWTARCEPSELWRMARQEPLLAAEWLSRANRHEHADGGFDCLSLEAAIKRLGPAECVRLAHQLAHTQPGLTHVDLQQLAGQLLAQQSGLGEILNSLARPQGLATEQMHTAVELSRLGELAVLCAIQNYFNYGGMVCDRVSLETLLTRFGPGFGNALKTRLRLPFPLRELIGALFKLPAGSLRKDRVIMRIAALEAGLAQDPGQLRQLRQWIGIEPD